MRKRDKKGTAPSSSLLLTLLVLTTHHSRGSLLLVAMHDRKAANAPGISLRRSVVRMVQVGSQNMDRNPDVTICHHYPTALAPSCLHCRYQVSVMVQLTPSPQSRPPQPSTPLQCMKLSKKSGKKNIASLCTLLSLTYHTKRNITR